MNDHDPRAHARAVLGGADPGIFAAILGAVLGRRHLLVVGYPGVGATMMVRAAYNLLPDVPIEYPRPPWAVDVLYGRDPIPRPPFRAPHHTVSVAGLCGGGTPPRPGEATLADGGVLFLDEWPEFSRACQQAITWIAHACEVEIVRARGVVTMPARATIIATAHACPCGFRGHPDRACIDPPSAIARYQARVDTFADLTPARVGPTRATSGADLKLRDYQARARDRIHADLLDEHRAALLRALELDLASMPTDERDHLLARCSPEGAWPW
jgi:magnesium chelatase family protein